MAKRSLSKSLFYGGYSMKTLLVCLLFGATSISAFSLENYFGHMNFSMSFAAPFGLSFSGDMSRYDYVIKDGFGDNYYTSYDPNVFANYSPGILIGLRIPAYYNDILSTGCALYFSIVNTHFTKNSYVGSGFGGAYFEYKFSQYDNSFLQNLSVLGSVGCGLNMINGGGKLKAAWAGDPGFYDGNEFHKPGSSHTIGGTSSPMFAIGVSAKYHLWKYVFLELGCNYYFKSKVDKFEAEIDGKKHNIVEQPRPLNISGFGVVFLGVGVGI
jgi:hypothetical protein